MTSANTCALPPAAITPVLLITAPFASRKVTLQPAGRVRVANVASVLACRSKVSATPLALDRYSVKRVVLPGAVWLVTTAATSGPAPNPGAAAPVELAVRSTVLTVMALSVSVAVALLPGLKLEVALFCTV